MPSQPSGRTSPTQPVALSPAYRQHALERLAEDDFDIVVVGGGITGAGAALDAVSRGLRVALVEAGDFACGTSSRSSKLIHGGLRYLQMLDFRLVREALGERRRLLENIAPHLVSPVEFVLPLRHRVWERLYLTAGLVLYDTLARRGSLARHRQLSRRRLLDRIPGLDASAAVGGVSFFDASEDDARLVLAVVRTAVDRGAVAVTGVRAVSNGQTHGACVVSLELDDGRTLAVRAKHVVYATGASADQLGLDTAVKVRPSKGVHLVVAKDRIDSDAGIIRRTPDGLLFVIPWMDHWLIGDTDTEWVYDRSRPVANGSDVDRLLRSVNSFIQPPLQRSDVLSVFAGVRPLVESNARSASVALSREHVVSGAGPQASVVAGGKYTTYRVMARDVVDRAVAAAGLQAGPSRTHLIPLHGADGPPGSAGPWPVDSAVVKHLTARYGNRAQDVLRSLVEHPTDVETVGPGPYLWAELRYAFMEEGARTLEDALERRTRIKALYADAGRGVIERVADLGAASLGWAPPERQAHIDRYLAVLDAEAAALNEPDDASAWSAYQAVLQRN